MKGKLHFLKVCKNSSKIEASASTKKIKGFMQFGPRSGAWVIMLRVRPGRLMEEYVVEESLLRGQLAVQMGETIAVGTLGVGTFWVLSLMGSPKLHQHSRVVGFHDVQKAQQLVPNEVIIFSAKGEGEGKGVGR